MGEAVMILRRKRESQGFQAEAAGMREGSKGSAGTELSPQA